MAMTPVDYDPFAQEPEPTQGQKVTPVDYDPFAQDRPAAAETSGQVAQSGAPRFDMTRILGIAAQGALEGAAWTADQLLNAPNKLANMAKILPGFALQETGEAFDIPLLRRMAQSDILQPQPDYPFAESALAKTRELAGTEKLVPQTGAERYAETTGQFVGGAAASGGITPSAPLRSLASASGAGVGVQTAREVAPGSTTAEVVGGVIGGMTPYGAQSIKNWATGRSPAKQKIAERIMRGETDSDLAKYMVEGGKTRTDQQAREAVRQGFDEGVISAVKGSSIIDREKMRQMVDVMKKGKKNARYAMMNRPGDVAGDSFLERVNYVKQVNRDAASQLDDVAKSLKGKTADFEKPVNQFLENLDAMGVRLASKEGKIIPRFKGSDVEGVAGAERLIKQLVDRMGSGKRPDAYGMHRLKRYIDEQVTYGKSVEGLGGQTERIVKQLRADIDGTLDKTFTAYNKVNSTYSETRGALDSIQDVAGKKMDLFGPNANKAVGNLLRRLMNNTQSRANLIDSMKEVQTTAKKYGGTFDDDIMTQVLFADELDSVFGPVSRTSLQGEVGKAVKRGAEFATGQRTITGTAIEGAAALSEKLRGVNEENAFKAIEELLKRQTP